MLETYENRAFWCFAPLLSVLAGLRGRLGIFLAAYFILLTNASTFISPLVYTGRVLESLPEALERDEFPWLSQCVREPFSEMVTAQSTIDAGDLDFVQSRLTIIYFSLMILSIVMLVPFLVALVALLISHRLDKMESFSDSLIVFGEECVEMFRYYLRFN